MQCACARMITTPQTSRTREHARTHIGHARVQRAVPEAVLPRQPPPLRVLAQVELLKNLPTLDELRASTLVIARSSTTTTRNTELKRTAARGHGPAGGVASAHARTSAGRRTSTVALEGQCVVVSTCTYVSTRRLAASGNSCGVRARSMARDRRLQLLAQSRQYGRGVVP